MENGGYAIAVDRTKTVVEVERLTDLKKGDMMSLMRKRAERMKPWTGPKTERRENKSQL